MTSNQQRAELQRQIWQIDQLRADIDAVIAEIKA